MSSNGHSPIFLLILLSHLNSLLPIMLIDGVTVGPLPSRYVAPDWTTEDPDPIPKLHKDWNSTLRANSTLVKSIQLMSSSTQNSSTLFDLSTIEAQEYTIKVEAPEDHGILFVIELLYMKLGYQNGSCSDYIQVNTSGREIFQPICGVVSTWNKFSTPHLTGPRRIQIHENTATFRLKNARSGKLLFTSYRECPTDTESMSNLRSCSESKFTDEGFACISKDLECNQEHNCGYFPSELPGNDETYHACATKLHRERKAKTQNASTFTTNISSMGTYDGNIFGQTNTRHTYRSNIFIPIVNSNYGSGTSYSGGLGYYGRSGYYGGSSYSGGSSYGSGSSSGGSSKGSSGGGSAAKGAAGGGGIFGMIAAACGCKKKKKPGTSAGAYQPPVDIGLVEMRTNRRRNMDSRNLDTHHVTDFTRTHFRSLNTNPPRPSFEPGYSARNFDYQIRNTFAASHGTNAAPPQYSRISHYPGYSQRTSDTDSKNSSDPPPSYHHAMRNLTYY